MSYEVRKYRSNVNKDRFDYFTLVHLETDLLIGVSKGMKTSDWQHVAKEEIHRLRVDMDMFIHKHPEFLSSYVPLDFDKGLPLPIQELMDAANIAGTGPMAGVAGLFATYVGRSITGKTSMDEVIIENGGDIYARVCDHLNVSIYAGKSPLSNKVGLKIPYGEWGICTSSGTVGHSTSFGKADAVCVVSKWPVVADALATALANKVNTEADINPVLESANAYSEIEGIVIIVGDKIGVQGKIELVGL